MNPSGPSPSPVKIDTSEPAHNGRGTKKSGSPWLEVAKHVVASAAGLGIGYVVLCFLRPPLDRFSIAPSIRSTLGWAPVPQPAGNVEKKPAVPIATGQPPNFQVPPRDFNSPLPSPGNVETRIELPNETALVEAAMKLESLLGKASSEELILAAADNRTAAERYLMLAAARDMAANRGEAELALGILRELATSYALDEPAALVALTSTLQANCRTPEQKQTLAALLLSHFRERFATAAARASAREALQMARDLAHASGDAALIQQADELSAWPP